MSLVRYLLRDNTITELWWWDMGYRMWLWQAAPLTFISLLFVIYFPPPLFDYFTKLIIPSSIEAADSHLNSLAAYIPCVGVSGCASHEKIMVFILVHHGLWSKVKGKDENGGKHERQREKAQEFYSSFSSTLTFLNSTPVHSHDCPPTDPIKNKSNNYQYAWWIQWTPWHALDPWKMHKSVN